MKAYELACSAMWAIRPESLEMILQIALRQQGESWEAISARTGTPLEHTHQVSVRDGIASIPVDGPLFKKANLMTRFSGATSYDTLMKDVQAALDDHQVKGIILSIDSPGGLVEGVSELASLIRSNRGRKPIVAHGWGAVASAAFWIASACDRLTIAPTSPVGSIGVISTVRNRKDPEAIEFISSVSPGKRPRLETPEGRALVQKEVDRLGEIFVEAVAAHRRTTPARVMKDFGQGSCLIGSDAVRIGMADGIGSFEDVHAELAAKVGTRPLVSFVPGPAPAPRHVLKFGT